MDNRKKVLLIMSRIPYPPIGGDRVKGYNLVKILSKHYGVTLVCLTDQKITLDQKQFLENYCLKHKIFYKSKLQSIVSSFKSIYNDKPLQVSYYYFNDVQKYINNETKSHDILINTLVRTSEYVLDNKSKPKLLDMVDLISLNYQRSKDKVNSILWQLVYNFEYSRLRKYEKKCLQNYNNSFLVNRQESEFCRQFGSVNWIPNGVNEKLLNYTKKNPNIINSVAFLGRMDYQPNIDATMWFVDNIFPLINKDINFYIVGSNPPAKISNLAKVSDRIHVTGFVDDPFYILNSCSAIVAPMQTGGGIQNKILEAMALGKVVITNSLGANPIIGAKDQVNLLCEDNISQYANLVNDVVNNKETYENIGKNAKKFVYENFTWASYENKLVELIETYI